MSINMDKTATALLLDKNFDLVNIDIFKSGQYEAVVCPFWLSPSIKMKISDIAGAPCYALSDIVDNFPEFEKEAYDLAVTLVRTETMQESFLWAAYLIEPLFQEFQILTALLKTAKFIEDLRRTRGFSTLFIKNFLGQDTSGLFSKILYNYPSLITLTADYPSKYIIKGNKKMRRILKLKNLFIDSLITRQWKETVFNVLEWADKKYNFRFFLGRHLSVSNLEKGGTVFLSSYENNSRILRNFSGLVPEPVRWCITNYSALKGIPKGNRYFWLWQFAPLRDKKFRNRVYKYDYSPKQGNSLIIKEWLALSPLWKSWLKTDFFLLQKLANCWDNFLDKVRPRLVVVASCYREYILFIKIAQAKGIPVLELMHGILGGYLYTKTPLISNNLVVWGDFWKNLWPEKEKDKIIVFRPEGYIREIKRQSTTENLRLTFFSWPLHSLPFYNFSEWADSFIKIIQRLLSQKRYKIKMRLHPGENCVDFIERWKRNFGCLPKGFCISRGGPLEGILAETDIAVMFRSTVLLDCFACEIPVIMPGWLDFGWDKKALEMPGVYLAKDFEDLEGKILEWFKNPPSFDKDRVAYFLKSSGSGKDLFCSGVGKYKTFS